MTGKLDDPEWRRERARKAGLARWARADRKAESDAARARLYARFADSPDPDAALTAAMEATEAPQADTS